MTDLEMVEIKKVRDETPTIKTFTLKKTLDARPGQFSMLWLPGVGEKPFSYSNLEGNVEFTVRKVGSFTEELFKLQKGDAVGLRGPYGEGCFKVGGKNVCVAAGGVGLAPMGPLIRELLDAKKKVSVIQGASTVKELFWIDELKDKTMLLLATDDGTCGSRGSVCDVFARLLESEKIDQVYTCGPEIMMNVIAELCLTKKVPCQVSLERYMKCGTGICGQCCIDPSGLRVCKEGPVFIAEQLKGSEFGKYRRDSSGSKQDI